MAALGEDLLGVVNKLQDLVFNTIGNDSLDLPQIVVVGSQSSGKSSVLENIVGRDFLPRGSGIVTRRPLILQLINVPSTASEPEGHDAHVPHTPASVAGHDEFAEFNHIPGRRFYDFSEVRREIENETNRIAGNNKGINRQPINLKVYSPSVLSLTLVDLPGLTKVPIGDQPTDIEKQTRTLISEYIAKPNSIILAVSPANVDIVNSEALKLARYVDPAGKRTIGVLTKLDLMDHGTNALDILSGRVYPLKLGFIGAVNRSQQDIQINKPMAESLAAERDFFRMHPAYRNIAQRCGTQFLAKTLNRTLMGHIRERLPDIKARLNTLMGQTQQELASYGTDTFIGKEHRGSLILQLMTRFATSFISSIDGTSSEISTKELCGGARIYYIFNSVFGNSLETVDPTHNLSVLDIRTAIRNSTGPRPSLFVPELAFDLLVKPQIKLLEAPSQRCVELVYEELIKICHTCGSNELSRYPRLQGKLIEVVSDLLRERLGPSSSYVESLISIQRAYINTNHPNFLGAAAAMSSVMQDKHEREKKAAAADEKRKREQKRRKELNGVNGTETPEDEDEDHQQNTLPVRQAQKPKESRSMSPAIGRDGHRLGHAPSVSNGATGGASGRDSFLNYFFGKESGTTGNALPGQSPTSTLPGGQRHVSQNIEPSIAASFRRGDTRPAPPVSIQEPEEETAVGAEEGTPGLDDPSGPALTEREALETELIRRLISNYFNIVRETIADQVPKAVMHLLVNHSKDVVQNRLVSELYRENLFEELLYEDDAVRQEREKCEKLLNTYREAAKIIACVQISVRRRWATDWDSVAEEVCLLKKAEIIPTVLDSFHPKLALDISWKHATAHVGNTVDPDKLQEPPKTTLSSLNHGEDTSETNPFLRPEEMQLTIALTDPDAPSRENPEWAQVCHWIATSGPKHGNAGEGLDSDLVTKHPHWKDIMPYKPPGPPPKTGKHRYVFVVLAPMNGTKEALNLVKPADRQHWGYEKADLGLREWADEMGLEVLGANFVYAQNAEQ
ncbi:dynamin GTPase [Hortaea werneckii]|nr:dynamin GTPase [Hortaea werneckii]